MTQTKYSATSAEWFVSMWQQLLSVQSPFLYIRLIFWVATIIISLLPFIGAETKIFSDWNITFDSFYRRQYEGILEVFLVTTAAALFDVLSVSILLAMHQSIFIVSTVIVFVVLTILFIVIGVSLGAYLVAVPKPEPMHWGFLTCSATLSIIATAFSAVLSNEYQPKKPTAKKVRA